MAYQKLQAGQAATVTASDTVGIPLPGGAGSPNVTGSPGTNTGGVVGVSNGTNWLNVVDGAVIA